VAFGRIVELTIGPPGGAGKLIKDLRIAFFVQKTDEESANKAQIEIYNLSDNSALEIGKAKNSVVLRAGYQDEGGAKNLFFGEVSTAVYKKETPETKLEITAFDGQSNIQEKNVSISYGPGITVQQIFNDLLSIFGLPLSNAGLVLSGSYANGYAFVGKAKDAITEVLSFAGKTWTIQNQQLTVISPGESVERTGLLISPSTGLLNTPEPLDDVDDDSTKEVPKRYKVRSLLFPQMVPGAEIQVESSIVNGTFRVETVEFTGDNFEGSFTSEAEVVQI
jgi:hypothetical protein